MTRLEMEQLERRPLHTRRNWSKADVFLAQWPAASGREVVIKDLRRRALWFRLLAGRYLLWREYLALQALRDVPGVPVAVARPDADSLVMEYHAGVPANQFKDGSLPAPALDSLHAIVTRMHQLGVTHGDLHQDNVLVDKDGSVTLIDWATAGVHGSRRGLKSWTFRQWAALDNRAVAKLKTLHAPRLLTEDERRLMLRGGSGFYRLIKLFRNSFDRLRGRRTLEHQQRMRAKFRRLLEKDL